MRTHLALVSAVLFVPALFGQKAEVFGTYSYLQYNTTVTGFQSRAFNGGGGGFQYNFIPYLGFKGEFNGYGSTEWTQVVKAPIGTPAGIIPVGTYTTRANMFTYMFGPVVNIPAKKVNVFGEILFGGTHTSGYADLYNSTVVGGKASLNPSQHPFAMAFGGGVDVNVNNHVALRLAQVYWFMTRFTIPFTQTNNQHNLRYQGGIVFKFGGM